MQSIECKSGNIKTNILIHHWPYPYENEFINDF